MPVSRSAISLPARLASEINEEADRTDESYSAVVAEAVAEFLGQLDDEELTRSMNRVYGAEPADPEMIVWLERAARETFAAVAADEDEPW